MIDRHPPRWHASVGDLSRLFGGGVLVIVGLLAGRADIAVLGAPLVLTVVWALAHTPTETAAVSVTDPRYHAGAARIEASLTVQPAAGVPACRLRVTAPGHRDRHVVVDARTGRSLTLSVVTARTGRQRLFAFDHQSIGVATVFRSELATGEAVTVTVLPQPRPLPALPLPPRLLGLTGAHRSVRPGDGGDLRDIDQFRAGDRLRRIDWKTTARRTTGSGGDHGAIDLYVRRTFATAEAQIMLVLDSRDALGPDVATWDTGELHPADATSLDVARRAAASLAQRYLDQGDRVGLVDLGRHRRPLRPAGGRRHLDRIVQQLATTVPDGTANARLRAPQVPSGALVVVLSTFVDDETAALAHAWHHTGHRVVAVDVLPPPELDRLVPRQLMAYRIVRMERDDRLAALADTGVEVVTWGHESSPDRAGDGRDVGVALTALTRTRQAGR